MRLHPRAAATAQAFLARFASAASAGFDPDRDLQRIGLANQTTMLMSESLAIGEMLKAAMTDRWGAEDLTAHFQAFDTICSATQDRQDAVVALLRDRPVDLMIVIGGYNSSNTANLARICAASRPTFHIADPELPGLARRDSAPTRWSPRRKSRRRLAAGVRPGHSRPDLRRIDAGQPRRRRDREARGLLRMTQILQLPY